MQKQIGNICVIHTFRTTWTHTHRPYVAHETCDETWNLVNMSLQNCSNNSQITLPANWIKGLFFHRHKIYTRAEQKIHPSCDPKKGNSSNSAVVSVCQLSTTCSFILSPDRLRHRHVDRAQREKALTVSSAVSAGMRMCTGRFLFLRALARRFVYHAAARRPVLSGSLQLFCFNGFIGWKSLRPKM